MSYKMQDTFASIVFGKGCTIHCHSEVVWPVDGMPLWSTLWSTVYRAIARDNGNACAFGATLLDAHHGRGIMGCIEQGSDECPPCTCASVVQKTKFKLETKTPSQFVRPVNSITEAKFQLSIPTGRLCSRTLKYCHILVLDVNLDAGTTGHETDIVSFVLSDLLTFLKVFKTNYTS